MPSGDLPPGTRLAHLDAAFPDAPDDPPEAPPDLPPDEPEEELRALRVDELVIDEATGEILAAPAGLSPDRLDWLIAQGVDAHEQEGRWTQAKGAYGAAVRRLLEDAGLRGYRCDYGAVSIRSRLTRTSRPERIEAVLTACELAPAQLDAIWRCAKELDPDLIQHLVYQEVIPQRVADGLVVQRRSRAWVQFTAPRRPSPRVTRGRARRR